MSGCILIAPCLWRRPRAVVEAVRRPAPMPVTVEALVARMRARL